MRERAAEFVIRVLCFVLVAEVIAHIVYTGRGIDYNTYNWVSGMLAICMPLVVGYFFKRKNGG